MKNSENSTKSQTEEYSEITKKSLVRVQYSCSGNNNSIEDEEYIPIVSNKPKNENNENEDKTKNIR